jgi:hypothetical protein
MAISRAGSLLAEKGLRPKVGSAAILTPGPPPDQTPAASAGKGKAKAPAKSQVKGPVPAKAQTQALPKAAAPARPNLSVVVINETGRPKVGEDYRAVLSQIGYRVLSVSEGAPGGQPGQTIITYQSGRQGQARALARRLPGPRHLVASSAPLPAEAVVVIR